MLDYFKNVFAGILYFLFSPSYELTIFLLVKYNLDNYSILEIFSECSFF